MLLMHASFQVQNILGKGRKERPVSWEHVWWVFTDEYPRARGLTVRLTNRLQLFYERIKC